MTNNLKVKSKKNGGPMLRCSLFTPLLSGFHLSSPRLSRSALSPSVVSSGSNGSRPMSSTQAVN